MSANGLQDKAWYRTLQVIRVLAYVFIILVAWGASMGANAYTYTDYSTGQLVSVPARPFDWHTAYMVFGVGLLVIEGIRAMIVYIFTGRNVLSENKTTPSKASQHHAARNDDELESWDAIKSDKRR